MLTRRDLLKMGVLGSSGYVLLPPGGGVARVSRFFDSTSRSPRLTPFVDPLPTNAPRLQPQLTTFANPSQYTIGLTGPQTQQFEIDVTERFVKFHGELDPTAVWAYVDRNSVAPPANQLFSFAFPVIRLGQKALEGFCVRVRNRLTNDPGPFGFPSVTVHFHGGHQPAAADGFPHDVVDANFPEPLVIPINGTYDYAYPFRDVGFARNAETSDERPSTYWFHDHLLDFTGANVYRGLANIAPAFDDLDTGDETTSPLRLPGGAFDLPLVLMDKTFDHSGALVFDPFNQDGFLGDTMLVNGVASPFLEVKRRRYRFRFLNGCNARIFQLFLTSDSGQAFPHMTQIATEGGLLGAPIRGVTSFLLHMAQRVEVVVDFADPFFDNQEFFYLENRMAQSNGRKPDGVVSRGTRLLQFRIDPAKADGPGDVPNVLRPFAPISASELASAEHHAFEFDRSHGVFTINGRPVDIEDPIASPRLNAPQIWTLKNSSGGWWHPIHIHSEFMRVIRRNGRTPPIAELDGNAKKDTVLLGDGETVDVFLKFRDYAGPFVFHCHNLGHEDMAMMGRFDVVP